MSGLGWSLFWRASKRRWVLKYRSIDGWAQKNLPSDIKRDEGPSRKKKTSTLESRAERWALEWLGNAEALKLRPRARPNGLTLRDASDVWRTLRKEDPHTSPATLKRFRGDFKNIVRPFMDGRVERSLGDEDVVSLSMDFALIRRWFRHLTSQLSAWRSRSAFSTLRSFFDDALVEKWVRAANPMNNEALVRELPALPNKADRGGIVLAELGTIQKLIDHRFVPLGRAARYILAVTSGKREGELSGMSWSVVHLDAEVPHVDVVRARRLVRDKGEVLGPLKTSTSRGVLPLHPAAVDALREWRDDEDNGVALLLGRKPTPHDPVFPSEHPRHGGVFSRPRSAKKLRADLTAASLDEHDTKGRNLTMHVLRKSFGTWLRRNGVAEPLRKALMRHGSNDVTEDFYTENLPEMAMAIRQMPLKWNVVPRVVPPLVSGGTKRPEKHNHNEEPRVGIEPTTCALRKHAPDDALGAKPSRSAVKLRAVPIKDNSQTADSGMAESPARARGTKRLPSPAESSSSHRISGVSPSDFPLNVAKAAGQPEILKPWGQGRPSSTGPENKGARAKSRSLETGDPQGDPHPERSTSTRDGVSGAPESLNPIAETIKGPVRATPRDDAEAEFEERVVRGRI